MNFNNSTSDQAILKELGDRITQSRIHSALTQKDLAQKAGISKRTLERIEAGDPSQLVNLIKIMKALGIIENLEAILPITGPSPMELLNNKQKSRQRVYKSRSGDVKSVNDNSQNWQWNDD